jgi:hypothetical protein
VFYPRATVSAPAKDPDLVNEIAFFQGLNLDGATFAIALRKMANIP